MAGVLVVVPALAAGATIAALPSASAAATTAVTVTAASARRAWSSRPGPQTFTVDNESDRAAEINLDNAAGGVVGEIETIGPATTASMTATLAAAPTRSSATCRAGR